MNRGAARRQIFVDDVERTDFLGLVGELDRRFALEIHAYCLMGNHYHLLVRSATGNLSVGLKHLGAVYTQRANRRAGLDGPVFRGRFHSVRVERDEHLAELVRYVHRNPIDLGWSRPLVAYRWSSHAAHAGLARPPQWLRTELVRSLFPDPASYRQFVERSDVSDVRDPNRHADDRWPTTPVVSAAVLPPSVDDVVEAVAAAGRSTPARVLERTPGVRNELRLVAVLLAHRLTTASPDDLATAFGFRSASGLRSALARARADLAGSTPIASIAQAATTRLAHHPLDLAS